MHNQGASTAPPGGQGDVLALALVGGEDDFPWQAGGDGVAGGDGYQADWDQSQENEYGDARGSGVGEEEEGGGGVLRL